MQIPSSAHVLPSSTTVAEPVDNVLIARMREHADLTAASAMPRGAARKQAVYDALIETATRTQASAIEALAPLQAAGVVSAVQSMHLPNALLITIAPGKSQAVTDALQGVADVASVTANKTWSIGSAPEVVRPIPVDPEADPNPRIAPNAIEWGVEKIGAPKAWARGIDGTGVTIGIVDTGLDAAHPAIRAHYRGTNADGTQTHDFNWFDGISGKDSPYDDGDHGTHVGGSSAGGADGGPQIGVAPGAKLIAAKAINSRGYNTTDGTLKALQWMLAPTKVDGTGADPSKGADVINNSWGNADRKDETFIETFAALKAAGIELVTAAGNDGPGAGTVSPPGSFPGYISVAATTSSDKVARFSSRGPSPFSKDELVPGLAAPGENVRSSVPGGGYRTFSGTSMASPHVAGAVALLLQAKPSATHDEIVRALQATAVDIDKPGPDAAAGYGRIDVNAAIDALAGARGIAQAA